MRLLCVDDDKVVLKLYQKILQRHFGDSLHVDTADTGSAALERLRKEKFQFLILDLGLPDMTGMEVLQRARTIDPGLHVIVLTAQESMASVIQAMNLGARAYLRKPFQSRELVDKLQQLRQAVENERQAKSLMSGRFSLKLQLSVMVAGLMLAATMIVGFLSESNQMGELLTERRARGEAILDLLAFKAGTLLPQEDTVYLREGIEAAASASPHLLAIRILTPTGELVMRTSHDTVGAEVGLPNGCMDTFCKNLLSQDAVALKVVNDTEAGVFRMGKRIPADGPALGWVLLEYSYTGLVDKGKRDKRRIQIYTFSAIAGGLLLSVLLLGYVLRPVRRLVDGVEKVAGGDFSHRIPVESRNEIGELATAFNRMVESLYRRDSQISALTETSRTLNTTLDTQKLLKKSVFAFNDIIMPEVALILLWDGTHMRPQQWSGLRPENDVLPSLIQWKADHPLVREAIENPSSQLLSTDAFKSRTELVPSWLVGNARQLLLAPLRHQDNLKGMVVLAGKVSPGGEGMALGLTDKEFADILASSITVALLNIELIAETAQKARMESELHTAELVQKTLLPPNPPSVPGIEVASLYRAASETGGDWFGYLEDRQAGRLFIFMGDVTGHGVPAALITAAASSYIRSLEFMQQSVVSVDKSSNEKALDTLLRPENILATLNHVIRCTSENRLLMTFFACVIDLNSRKVRYANAGHEMPVWLRSAQPDAPEVLAGGGTRLGDAEEPCFEIGEAQLGEGDCLIFFTDGIPESMNPEGREFGSRRFLRALQAHAYGNPAEICSTVEVELEKFTQGRPPDDDLTMVVAKLD